MNDYYKWSKPSNTSPSIRISYTNSSNSSTSYDITYWNDAINAKAQKLHSMIDEMYLTEEDVDDVLQWTISYKTRTYIGLHSVHYTEIPQKAEDALLDYVSELDRAFLIAIGDTLDCYLHDKAYSITESVLRDELDGDRYYLPSEVSEEAVVQSIVCSMNFYNCYEIIKYIVGEPQTSEEYLRDVGMSINDFL